MEYEEDDEDVHAEEERETQQETEQAGIICCKRYISSVGSCAYIHYKCTYRLSFSLFVVEILIMNLSDAQQSAVRVAGTESVAMYLTPLHF